MNKLKLILTALIAAFFLLMVSCSTDEQKTLTCGTVEFYEIDKGNPQISGDEIYIIYFTYIDENGNTKLKTKYINFNEIYGAIGESTQQVKFYPIGSQYCE